MTDIRTLADSFDLPDVDRSKWVVSGTHYQQVAPYGLKFTHSDTVGQVTKIESASSFTMFGSNVYLNYDMTFHWNAHFNFCIFDPATSEEFGFDIRGYETLTSGDVAEVTDVTLTGKGAKWTVNQWVNARVVITSGPGAGEAYNILSNSENALQLDSDGWNTKPTTVSNYRIEAITLAMYRRVSGVRSTYKKIYMASGPAGLLSNIRWLRITDTRFADRIYYDVSSDGVNWNNVYFVRNVPISTTRKFKVRMGFYKEGDVAYDAPEWLIVKLFNTRKQIYRGAPGQYLSNDFNLMTPAKEFLENVQWDIFQRAVGTTSARIDSSPRRLALRGGTVRSSLRTTIRDVDIRFTVQIATTSASMIWRFAGTSYIGLQILPTSLVVFATVSGVRTDLYTYAIANTSGVSYSFRIVHAGATVVVYRDGGDYNSMKVITFPEELFRVPGVGQVTQKGHIGMQASTSDVFFDNLTVQPGTTPPPLVWTPDDNLPAVVTNPQQLPPGFPPDERLLVGHINEMRLVELGYADLLLFPTPAIYYGYGGVFPQDYDLGEPTYKEFVEDLAGAPGTRDYTTLYGAKNVTMTLAAVPGLLPETQNTTTNYLVDLVARWCAPHRRPRLFYKPHDGPERYIDLVPTPLSRPVTVDQHRDFTILQIGFKVPMGIEEEVTPKMVEVTTDFEPTTVVTLGTKVALPILRIYGPCTNPVVYNDSLDFDGNARLGLTGTIEDGEFIELNCRTKTVRYMGSPDPGANRRDMLTTKGWFGLVPFTNALRLESDDGLGTVTIEYRETF